MRLTQHTDYSLRVLRYLGLTTEKLVTIQEISDNHDISRNHLMKVVQRLARSGYVQAVRGKRGGLRLSRDARLIKVGDVVRDLEPDLALVECMRAENHCVSTPACRLTAVMHSAQEAFVDALNRFTISDLLAGRTSSQMITLLNIGD